MFLCFKKRCFYRVFIAYITLIVSENDNNNNVLITVWNLIITKLIRFVQCLYGSKK